MAKKFRQPNHWEELRSNILKLAKNVREVVQKLAGKSVPCKRRRWGARDRTVLSPEVHSPKMRAQAPRKRRALGQAQEASSPGVGRDAGVRSVRVQGPRGGSGRVGAQCCAGFRGAPACFSESQCGRVGLRKRTESCTRSTCAGGSTTSASRATVRPKCPTVVGRSWWATSARGGVQIGLGASGLVQGAEERHAAACGVRG